MWAALAALPSLGGASGILNVTEAPVFINVVTLAPRLGGLPPLGIDTSRLTGAGALNASDTVLDEGVPEAGQLGGSFTLALGSGGGSGAADATAPLPAGAAPGELAAALAELPAFAAAGGSGVVAVTSPFSAAPAGPGHRLLRHLHRARLLQRRPAPPLLSLLLADGALLSGPGASIQVRRVHVGCCSVRLSFGAPGSARGGSASASASLSSPTAFPLTVPPAPSITAMAPRLGSTLGGTAVALTLSLPLLAARGRAAAPAVRVGAQRRCSSSERGARRCSSSHCRRLCAPHLGVRAQRTKDRALAAQCGVFK